MNCYECGSEMRLDDTDYNFKGNKDEYWECGVCRTSCIREIRFSKPHRDIWHSESYVPYKDYIIKYEQ